MSRLASFQTVRRQERKVRALAAKKQLLHDEQRLHFGRLRSWSRAFGKRKVLVLSFLGGFMVSSTSSNTSAAPSRRGKSAVLMRWLSLTLTMLRLRKNGQGLMAQARPGTSQPQGPGQIAAQQWSNSPAASVNTWELR